MVAVAVGLLLVVAVAMVVWVAETRSSAPLGDVMRTGAAFWLLGHGARLHLPDGTAALIPLGLSVLFAALASRAGAKVARVRPAAIRKRAVLGSALCVALPYAAATAVIARIASGGGLHVFAAPAALGAFLLSGAAAAIGAARELPRRREEIGSVRAAAAGIAAAGAVLLAVCAFVAAVALVTHLSDAAALAKPERAGAVGGVGLLLLQASLAPNVMAWTGAYLLGPGFAVGSGTMVSPSRVHLGDVPGLPMLAGLPSGPAAWPLNVLYVVPVIAGVVAGVVVLRRLPRVPRMAPAALIGAAVAASIALLAALAAALSGGGLTSGRLQTIGPSALPVGLWAAVEVGVPASLTVVALTFYRRHWQHRTVPAGRETVVHRLGGAVSGAVSGAASRAATAAARPFARVRRAQRGPDAFEADASDEAADELYNVEDDPDDGPPVVDLTKHVGLTKYTVVAANHTIDLTREVAPLAPAASDDDCDFAAEATQPLDLAGLADLVRRSEAADPAGSAAAEDEPAQEQPVEHEPPGRRRIRRERRAKG